MQDEIKKKSYEYIGGFLLLSSIIFLLILYRFSPLPTLVLLIGLCSVVIYRFLKITRNVTYFLNVLQDELKNMNSGRFNNSTSDINSEELPAKAVESLEILEEVKEKWRVKRLENQLLYDTARFIYSFSTPEELLDTFTARLTSHFNADFGYLLINKNDSELVVKAAFGIEQLEMEKTLWGHGEGLAGKAVEDKEPVLCADVEEDPRYIRAVAGTRSLLLAPLLVGNSAAGVMVMGSFGKYRFNQTDLDFLTSVAGEIGLVLENARLSGELRERMKELSTLYEATKAISASVDLRQVLKTTIKYIYGIISARSCSLMLLDDDSGELRIEASIGLNEDTCKAVKLKIGQGIAGRVAQLNTSMQVADVSDEPQYKEFPEQKEGLRSILSVPLEANELVLGVINIDTDKPLSHNSRQLVENLASRAAVAIEKAILYQNMKELAIKDGLTGLYNYRYFQERLEEEIQRADRHRHPLSVVMIDIDNFKLYNDKYGHPTGDALLQELAKILTDNIRNIDVAARYGGEEFVLILPETNSDNAYLLVDRLRSVVDKHEFEFGSDLDIEGVCEPEEPIKNYTAEERDSIESDFGETVVRGENLMSRLKKIFSGINIGKNYRHSVSHVTISCGICSYPDKAKDMEELITKADQGLMNAKQKGKNEVLIYPPESSAGEEQEYENKPVKSA